MWNPGRFTKVGIALTFVGMLLVFLTWEVCGSAEALTSRPNESVLWLAFPLCGPVLGWSLKLSRAALLGLFVGMLMHWVIIGLLLDRAVARRAGERIGSPPN